MDQSIAIVGYGNQAKVWAQNFRDSGWAVTVLLRKSSSNISVAQEHGFQVEYLDSAHKHKKIALLISDHEMLGFFKNNALADGSSVIFAHGSTLLYHFEDLPKTVSYLMLSPKMIADEVRSCYVNKQALPCVLDVFFSHDPDQDKIELIKMAKALGCSETFQMFYPVKTEVHADFFSEQAVLCGGVPKLLMQAVETMVSNGIPEDLAYLECGKELEIFMRLFNQKGLYNTMKNISPSALYGSASYVQETMPQTVLQESFDRCMQNIQSGKFYSDLQKASEQGLKESKLWKEEMQSSKLNVLSENYIKQKDQ